MLSNQDVKRTVGHHQAMKIQMNRQMVLMKTSLVNYKKLKRTGR